MITLVLYFGTEQHWNAAKSLKNRLSVNEKLQHFVQDYKINLFELAWLSAVRKDSAVFAFAAGNSEAACRADFRALIISQKTKTATRFPSSRRVYLHSGNHSYKLGISPEPPIMCVRELLGGADTCGALKL